MEIFPKKGHLKIWSAKFSSCLPKLSVKSLPMMIGV